MENKKYVVCRDDIYVGEVVRTNSVYRYDGDRNIFRTKPGQLNTDCWRPYRSMLFVPNENKLSNDLLYRSPNYPILNVTDDKTCLNLGENSVVIKDACNLAALLEYFGYQKDLTFEDIMKIRKTFFTGRFAKDNCQLFGYKETMAEDLTFYVNGAKVTNPRELEYRRRQFRADQRAGHRMFSRISTSQLPIEYFDVLDVMGDNIFAFVPDKQEGPVKRLKKF